MKVSYFICAIISPEVGGGVGEGGREGSESLLGKGMAVSIRPEAATTSGAIAANEASVSPVRSFFFKLAKIPVPIRNRR